jgi:hypothetical protein
MRCSSSVIYNIIGEMSETLKLRIRDLGFGQLLHFKIDKIEDIALAMFLANYVKEDPLRIEVGHKVLPITSESIKLVFGILASGQGLPKYTAVDKRMV